MTRSTAVVVVALIAISGPARAQNAWEIGARLGGGPSIVSGKYGGVPEGGLLVASVYVARPVLRWKGFAAGYVAELAPLVVMTKVPTASGYWLPWYGNDSVYVFTKRDSGAVAGVGFQPVGLRLSQQIGSGLLAYAEASGGGVAFARAVPDPAARSLNFLVSAGGGIRIGRFGHRSYVLGYRFTHISNAYTVHTNPGYNAHIIYLGLTIR